MARQTNTVWYIGQNRESECGVEGEAKSLKLCAWSEKISNVLKISRGYDFNIYTVSSTKDEFAVNGFIRNAQKLLPFEMNTFYIIPASIILLCLNYFGNYFNQYYSAGGNDNSQLGRTNKDEKIIAPIPELNNISIKHISSCCNAKGAFWICNDGKVYIHGWNHYGVFGSDYANTPVPIIADDIPSKDMDCKIIQAVVSKTGIVLCDDGKVWSVGTSYWHEHGHGKETKQFTPLEFPVRIKKVALGSGTSIFLGQNGELWGCGYNSEGTLGLDHRNDMCRSIVKITWFEENAIIIKDLEMGQYHCIALGVRSNIYCWGRNLTGECAIDNNVTGNVLIPHKVEYELKDIEIKEIRAGSYHTGCITKDDQYYIWGANKYNESCIESSAVNVVYEPNNITKYIFEKTQCQEILDMVLARFTTMFLLRGCSFEVES